MKRLEAKWLQEKPFSFTSETRKMLTACWGQNMLPTKAAKVQGFINAAESIVETWLSSDPLLPPKVIIEEASVLKKLTRELHNALDQLSGEVSERLNAEFGAKLILPKYQAQHQKLGQVLQQLTPKACPGLYEAWPLLRHLLQLLEECATALAAKPKPHQGKDRRHFKSLVRSLAVCYRLHFKLQSKHSPNNNFVNFVQTLTDRLEKDAQLKLVIRKDLIRAALQPDG